MSDPARTWLVTGCTSGFGHALVEALVGRGQKVVATARDPSRLAALVAMAPDRVLPLRLDVTAPDDIARALDEARAAFGHIDVLVNNAGAGHIGFIEDVPLDVFRSQLDLNFLGPLALIKAVLPDMRARRSGQIVNIASIAGLVGFPRVAAYSASKFSLVGLSEALASEVAGLGIKVTVAELGPFATSFSTAMQSSPVGSPDYEDSPPSFEIGTERWTAGDDPAAGATALLDALFAESPPLHLLLGGEAVRVARMYEERRATERAPWLATSLLGSSASAAG